MNYAQLAFTDRVKEFQEDLGSRQAYERMEKLNQTQGLTENEINFINFQDHFFMASFGENGYPYIQHRGGPEGFLKVLDKDTLAFVDFIGNRQYISVGNISTNGNVSLILVSYPYKARLKIYAKAEILDLKEAPDLFKEIDPKNYRHRSERIIKLKVQAYDWNCPQHITPRFTMKHIEQLLQKEKKHIGELQEQVESLKNEIKGLKAV